MPRFSLFQNLFAARKQKDVSAGDLLEMSKTYVLKHKDMLAQLSSYERFVAGSPNPNRLETLTAFQESYAHYIRLFGKVDVSIKTYISAINKQPKDVYTSLKKLLPAYTGSATYKANRRAKDFEKHSGVLIVDVDNIIDESAALKLLDGLKNSPFIEFSGLSASHKGVFLAVKCRDINTDNHKAFFEQLEEDFYKEGITIDKACKDVNRLRILSDHFYINQAADRFIKLDKAYVKKEILDYSKLDAIPLNDAVQNVDNLKRVFNVVLKRHKLNAAKDVYPLFFNYADAAKKYGFYDDIILQAGLTFFDTYSERQDRDGGYVYQAMTNGINAYPESHQKYQFFTHKNKFDDVDKSNDIVITLDRKHITNANYRFFYDNGLPINFAKNGEIATNKLPDRCIVEAQTGAGKTEALVRNALEHKTYPILAVPYKILAEQQSTRFKELGLQVVTGDTTKEELKNLDYSAGCAVTYDSIHKVLHNIPAHVEITAIIDEFHNLSDQVDFRAAAMQKVERLMKISKYVRLVSGTIERLWQLEGFDVVRFETQTDVKHRYSFKTYKQSRQKFRDILHEVLDAKASGGRVAIRNNNKKVNKTLYKTLERAGVKTLLFQNDENIEDTAYYSDVVEFQKIRQDFDVIIMTSKLDDGSQIFNENIKKVIVLNPESFTPLIQLPNRFRACKDLDILMYFTNNAIDSKSNHFVITEKDNEGNDIAKPTTRKDYYQKLKKKVEGFKEAGEISTGIIGEYSNTIMQDSNDVCIAGVINYVNKKAFANKSIQDFIDYLHTQKKEVDEKIIDLTQTKLTKESEDFFAVYEQTRKDIKQEVKESEAKIKAALSHEPTQTLEAAAAFFSQNTATAKHLKKLNIKQTPSSIQKFAENKQDFLNTATMLKKFISELNFYSEEAQSDDIQTLANALTKDDFAALNALKAYRAAKLVAFANEYENLNKVDKANAKKYQAAHKIIEKFEGLFYLADFVKEFNAAVDDFDKITNHRQASVLIQHVANAKITRGYVEIDGVYDYAGLCEELNIPNALKSKTQKTESLADLLGGEVEKTPF